jgi:hypothetical protein
MKRIDKQIILAVSSLKQVCITNDETGNRLGISGKHVSQIIKGEVESIRPSTWKIMEPVLRPFLKNQMVSSVEEDSVSYSTKNPEIRRLIEWLETDACPDQIAAVLATARAVGCPNGSTSSSHSGTGSSPSAAKVA